MAKLSRKAYLELFRSASPDLQERYKGAVRNDLISEYVYLSSVDELFNYRYKSVFERVVEERDFETMLDLHLKAGRACEAYEELKKHFKKLEESL